MNSKPQRKSKPSSKPSEKEEAQPVLGLPEKLEEVQAHAAKWGQLATSPSLSLTAALAARNLQRSWAAAAGLYQKGLGVRAEPEETRTGSAAGERVAGSVGIIPSLPDQPPSLGHPSPPSSTKPETSA